MSLIRNSGNCQPPTVVVVVATIHTCAHNHNQNPLACKWQYLTKPSAPPGCPIIPQVRNKPLFARTFAATVADPTGASWGLSDPSQIPSGHDTKNQIRMKKLTSDSESWALARSLGVSPWVSPWVNTDRASRGEGGLLPVPEEPTAVGRAPLKEMRVVAMGGVAGVCALSLASEAFPLVPTVGAISDALSNPLLW